MRHRGRSAVVQEYKPVSLSRTPVTGALSARLTLRRRRVAKKPLPFRRMGF